MPPEPIYNSIFTPNLFHNHRILITGGGTGIGRCIAHELASLGAHVIIAGRRKEQLERTCAEIRSVKGQKCDTAVLNIRDPEQIRQVVQSIVETHGPLNGLVNNAGGQFPSPAELITENGWRSVIDLNLTSTFLVTQTLFHTLPPHHHPFAIVNVVADIRNGKPWMSHTAAARAGVVNLTKTLSQEWGPRGVRVNCVAPGTILGNGMRNYAESVREHVVENHYKNPLGRMGTEAEIASVVTFLLSPGASFVTGTCVYVTGGGHLRKRGEDPEPYSEETKVPPYFGFREVGGGAGRPGYFAEGKPPEGFEGLVERYVDVSKKSHTSKL
ncbi:hypothetical protein HDV05_002525 [Chytridiales sp. JEL 0842]|nr:hypothetical protein HDV05_002525 [Chytridiales sp. JEL 0842]